MPDLKLSKPTLFLTQSNMYSDIFFILQQSITYVSLTKVPITQDN